MLKLTIFSILSNDNAVRDRGISVFKTCFLLKSARIAKVIVNIKVTRSVQKTTSLVTSTPGFGAKRREAT